MKKIVLLFALISISYFSNAQSKKLKEGVAEFDVSYPSLTTEMKQMESMLPKILTIYFKNDQSRVEMNTSMGSTAVLSDNTKKEVIVLMDMMDKKIAIKQSQEDLAKKEAELKKSGKMPDFTIVETKETKIIAGYKCKKAIVQYTLDGKKEQMICYYTEDLPRVNSSTDNMALKEIKGFLMEYNINQSGIQMRILAKNVKAQKVEDKLFLIPDDYKIMTQNEISDMMNGAGKSSDGK
jgi:GLPGLI family protein